MAATLADRRDGAAADAAELARPPIGGPVDQRPGGTTLAHGPGPAAGHPAEDPVGAAEGLAAGSAAEPAAAAAAAGVAGHEADPAGEAAPFWLEARRVLRGAGTPKVRRELALLLLAIGAVLVCNVAGQVRLNNWNGDFFDSLEQKGLQAFGRQLGVFIQIVAVLLTMVVAQTWLQQMVKLRLRAALTQRQLDGWLRPGRAYRLAMTSELGSHPDQRMQEDTRLLTELSVELGVGVLHSTVLLVAFVGVLWTLSADVVFTALGVRVAIPGYMVWCALGYALVGSGLTWLVGRSLIGLNAQRYAREADLRFALVRVGENAESVSLYAGEASERRALDRPVEGVIQAMRRLSGALSRLMWITSGYGWLGIVVPVLVAAPAYFGGGLTLGGLMVVVGAFGQVQMALRYYVDNFPRFADWRASLRRVAELCEALDDAEEAEEAEAAPGGAAAARRIRLEPHPEGALAFEGVSLFLSDGTAVMGESSAAVRPGERVLITGPSGSGKSTLMRAVAGLWPWGTGTILLPPRERTLFMPQRPYLPLGSLRGAVTYPAAPDAFDRATVEAALGRVGLAELVPSLDGEERWDKALSIGQQQRLAFARLLLHRPDWVFLDEATAALDEDNQANVMAIFDRELPDAAVLSIGHRPGLEAFHSRTLELVGGGEGPALLRPKRRGRPADRRIVDRALAALVGRFLARAD